MIENIIEKKYRNRFNRNEEETHLSQEDSHNNNHLFVCEICGTNMPIKDKEDHLLCHEIESEERKNDIVINLASNEVNEQDSQYMSKKIINKAHAFDYYPTSLIKDINKLAEDKKRCGICLENFQNGDESIFLSCAHIFHSKCIRRWVKRRKACPFCNYKINIPRLINIAMHGNRNRNNINFGVTDFLASGRSDDSGSEQSYENENSYNSNSNSYNSNINSYNSNINSIDYSSSYYNSNENSILHFRSSHNSYNSNLFNSNSYNSSSNSIATSNLNLNSVSSSNSSSNSNQMNDSLFDYIKGNYSIKNKESSKYSLSNDINKSKSNQYKEESNYSIKNITSNKEDEKEEKDEEDEEEKDNEDKDEDEKEDDEKNKLQKIKKRYENISKDNNIEILYILDPKRNSMTYTNKNNYTKNTHRTSIFSSKINNQNIKYNYLDNLPLKEKIKSRKRSNSTDVEDINSILNKEVLAKNKNSEILLYKLKNLNMSLEKEKSYVKYFKYLTGKNYPNYKKQNKINNNSNNQKNIISSQIELFIKNNDNLHKKVHKSNLFEKLGKNINI